MSVIDAERWRKMRVVQTLWIGPAIGEIQQLSIRSFLNCGHEYHLYTYDDIAGVPDGAMVKDAAAILPKASIFRYEDGFGKGSYSAFSNLFRYQLLYKLGGWWVDADLVCLKPFAFENDYVFATERDSDDTINCATSAIWSPPGAEVLRYCADVAAASDKATLQWGQIGPQLLTVAVARFGLDGYRVPVETFNPIHFFEFGEILQPGFDRSRLDRSSAVHLWNQMWHQHNVSLAGAAPDSLYGILRGQYLTASREPAAR